MQVKTLNGPDLPAPAVSAGGCVLGRVGFPLKSVGVVRRRMLEGFPDTSQKKGHRIHKPNPFISNKSNFHGKGTFAHTDVNIFPWLSTTEWVFLINLHWDHVPRWEESRA